MFFACFIFEFALSFLGFPLKSSELIAFSFSVKYSRFFHIFLFFPFQIFAFIPSPFLPRDEQPGTDAGAWRADSIASLRLHSCPALRGSARHAPRCRTFLWSLLSAPTAHAAPTAAVVLHGRVDVPAASAISTVTVSRLQYPADVREGSRGMLLLEVMGIMALVKASTWFVC